MVFYKDLEEGASKIIDVNIEIAYVRNKNSSLPRGYVLAI